MALNSPNSISFQQALYLWLLFVLHTVVMLGSGVMGQGEFDSNATSLFLSLIFSQWTLMSIWITLGRTRARVRIPIGIIHLFATHFLVIIFLPFTVVNWAEFAALQLVHQLFCVVLPLFMFRWFGWQLVVFNGELRDQLDIKAKQFSLRSLFLWMLIIALLLCGIRPVLTSFTNQFAQHDGADPFLYYRLSVPVTCAIVGLLTFWLILGTGNVWFRLMRFLLGSGISIFVTLWFYCQNIDPFAYTSHARLDDGTSMYGYLTYTECLNDLVEQGSILFSQGIWIFFTLAPFRLRGLHFCRPSSSPPLHS